MKLAVIPVTLFSQNCTLLWDEATMRATVVDPGGDVEEIAAEIRQLGLTVEKIVLTHGHIDHAGGAAELRDRYGVPVEGTDRRDAFLLDKLEEQGAAYGMAARNLVPDRWLAEGETVEIAGVPFSILHCPGHTPGSLVYVNAPGHFALVGDVLFHGSVGRTDFAYGSSDDLMAAIRTKLLPLGDELSFICGHGPGSTIGAERRSNPFLRRG